MALGNSYRIIHAYWDFFNKMRSFDVFFDLRVNKRWVNNREAGDLRRHRAHYDINVMKRDWLNQFYAKGNQSHPHKIKNMINYSFSWFQCRYG